MNTKYIVFELTDHIRVTVNDESESTIAVSGPVLTINGVTGTVDWVHVVPSDDDVSMNDMLQWLESEYIDLNPDATKRREDAQ